MAKSKMKIGDRVKFRAVRRWSTKTAIRVIVGFDMFGRPEVRFDGWPRFVVRHEEILTA